MASDYITGTFLKASLGIASSYADADIAVAITAASRACDGYKSVQPGMFASASGQTRYYTGHSWDPTVDIDPLNTLTSVKVDTDGDGVYETTWTNNTDFVLNPRNGATDGIPYTQIQLLPQRGRTFPNYLNSIEVQGTFGWATTPAGVTQATSILAGRLLKRARETPYGILTVSGDAVAAARLGRIDPDVAFLLDNLPGATPTLVL